MSEGFQGSLADALARAELFVDGDWVESKDQDPEGDVRLIQLADIGDGEYINKSARFLTSAKAHQLRCTFLKPGDVLVARMPDPLGRACIFPGDSKPSVTVVDVCIIRPHAKHQDSRWLMHYLNSPVIRNQIAGFTTGTTRSRISRGNLAKVKVVVPLLDEQRRIANVLDRGDALRAKRRAALAQLDTLTQSIFLDLFGDPVSNPKNVNVVRLADVATRITDGVHQRPNYTESGIPFISVKDVTTGKLIFDECRFISLDDHERFTKRCKPERLDILYTKVGATYGRPAIVETDREFSIYVSVCLIKPDKDLIDPHFLHAALGTSAVKKQADRRIKGIGVPDLHLDQIRSFLIPLPPMNHQCEFSRRVQAVEKQKAAQRASLQEMDALFASLQHRAFRGEL